MDGIYQCGLCGSRNELKHNDGCISYQGYQEREQQAKDQKKNKAKKKK